MRPIEPVDVGAGWMVHWIDVHMAGGTWRQRWFVDMRTND